MNHSIKKVVSFLLVFTILITTCTTVLLLPQVQVAVLPEV